MSDTQPMHKTVAVRLSDELLRTAKEESRIAGISLSDAIRISLSDWVKQKKRNRYREKIEDDELSSKVKGQRSNDELLQLIKKLTSEMQ